MTNDVTKPPRPNPPTSEPMRPRPSKIQPPTMVSGGAAAGGAPKSLAPNSSSFTLPETVPAREQWNESRRRTEKDLP